MADGRGPRIDLPRVDLHSHAGRCFLAGLPAGHSLVATMGAAAVADAVRADRAAGMTALVLAAVADFAVLRPDPATGLRAHRDFRAGEAYADYQRQLAGIRAAVAEAGAEVATSAADLERAARDGRTVVLLGCEGGDFLEGDLGRLEEARAAGLTVLTLVRYRVSDIGDVQTEAPVHDGLSRFGRGGRGRRPGRRLALRHHQPVPRRLRHRDHPARRGGRPGARGPRYRPRRKLPPGPDQLRPARRPDRPAARPWPPAGQRPPDPRRQRPEPAGPRALTGIYTGETGLRGCAARRLGGVVGREGRFMPADHVHLR